MKLQYNKRFLKDLSKIPLKEREKIETLVFEELQAYSTLNGIPQLEKLSGYTSYY